ncbi:4Fe-4S binding protein [Dendrosporobacter sp. 1207_IL3150]|uniref:4Fe-4S binding protein n=1 Tax=Dendrosporobacter sp. 1207_IL3150 TaxID=3084054 RepID=UPI002FDA363E
MKNNIQPYLFWILIFYLIIGTIYPIIGVLALICMLAPVIMAPKKGRHWCGNYCPRGSFYDSVISRISPNITTPPTFRKPWFRTFMVFFIMGVFSIQMYFAWGDLTAIGAVFIQIILITTIVGIILGSIYHQRTWCNFCPMGTLASWASKKSKPLPLKVETSCVECNLCNKVCPMNLSPHKEKGSEAGFSDSDCLKCSKCITKCPKKALSF